MSSHVIEAVEQRQMTTRVYGLIRDGRFVEAATYLGGSDSRAALSLLGYCQYNSGAFVDAVGTYSKLVDMHPSQQQYILYLAQAQYKSGSFAEAAETLTAITDPILMSKANHLSALVEFEGSAPDRALAGLKGNPERHIFEGCVLAKQGDWASAKHVFTSTNDRRPFMLYNQALCAFNLGDYQTASELADKIIKASDDELDCKIEALNLKGAILFTQRDWKGLRRFLSEQTSKSQTEMDAVSLHNSAIYETKADDTRSSSALSKLMHLLSLDPRDVPVPTASNALLIAMKCDRPDIVDSILRSGSSTSQDLRDIASAYLIKDPDAALSRFDDVLKSINLKRSRATGEICDLQDTALTLKCCVLWNSKDYKTMRKLLSSATDAVPVENANINLAHCAFMEENYSEAIKLYGSIFADSADILRLPESVVANLAVSLILESRNDEAEILMRKLDDEERIIFEGNSKAQCFHLTTVEMAIGTLYCARGNFEFGISRVLKSMFPLERRLGLKTWTIAIRALMGLAAASVKGYTIVRDSIWQEAHDFIDAVMLSKKQSVESEIAAIISKQARTIKLLFLKLRY